MSCKYSCMCGGFCPGCTNHEPEQCIGHAEDFYDSMNGTPQDNREAESYYAKMEQDYYENHPDNPKNQIKEG